MGRRKIEREERGPNIGGKDQRKRGGEEGMRRVRGAKRRSCEEREGQVEVRRGGGS